MTDRNQGTGPFSVKSTKDQTGPAGSAVVLDVTGEAFCFVDSDYCAGKAVAAAKARATRIAEALNHREGHAAPAPYVDDHGNLCAPAGYGFVANGEKCEMVPLISIKLSPAP